MLRFCPLFFVSFLSSLFRSFRSWLSCFDAAWIEHIIENIQHFSHHRKYIVFSTAQTLFFSQGMSPITSWLNSTEWDTQSLTQQWMEFYTEMGVPITTLPHHFCSGKWILGPFTGFTAWHCSFLTHKKVGGFVHGQVIFTTRQLVISPLTYMQKSKLVIILNGYL